MEKEQTNDSTNTIKDRFLHPFMKIFLAFIEKINCNKSMVELT
jgi:hypothetical protein